MSITHLYVSTGEDDADSDLIRPSDWNADHVGTNEHTHADTDTGGIIPGTSLTKINHQIQLMGSSITPATTNGCGFVSLEMATNKNTLTLPAFDPDTVEYGDWWHELPSDYDGGTVTFHVNWTHPAATAFKVAWSLKAVGTADGDSLDSAYGTAVQVNDEGGTTHDKYTTAESAALTIAGSPVAGEMVNWRLSRVATDGTNDTLNVDAYPISVTIAYTRTA